MTEQGWHERDDPKAMLDLRATAAVCKSPAGADYLRAD
jgi:hypothetical protein